METQYSEINQNEILSENKKHAISACKTNDILFVIAFIVSLIFIGLSVWFFCNNNIYKGDKEWVIKHDVVGTYGDFIGGVLGTIIALYSAYLLVRTLGNQLSVNGDVMDTNKNVISNVQKITSAENLRSRASDEIVPFREFIIKDDTSALL